MERKLEASRYYDSIASSYTELYGVEQARKHALALSLAGVDEDDVVLDVGCGDGALLERVADRCSLAVGLDASREMLRRARERRSNASLVLADAEALPFRDCCFTVAFMITVLHNLSSPGVGLREAWRVLKPRGRCFATWLKKAGGGFKLKDLLLEAGLRPIELLNLDGVEDLMSLALKVEAAEGRAYLRLIRNVRRGLELRSAIIKALKGREQTAKKLAEQVGVSYASALRQLRNLEREEVVERLGKPPFKWRVTGKGQLSLLDYLQPGTSRG